MSKLPSKKTTKTEKEEPKKLKTTGRVAKPKTTTEKIVKTSVPKKKGEKAPTAIKEIVSKPKAEPKPKAETKPKATRAKTKNVKTPIKLTEDNVSSPVTNSVPIMERVGPAKTKRFKEDRYVKVPTSASSEDFALIGKRVQNGELQWAFFAVTNEDQSCHYYLDLTKK